MDATIIGAIFTGLSALLVAWANMRNQRSGVSGSELRAGRRERRRLEDQMLAIRRWGLRCETRLIEERVEDIPRRPVQFDLDWGREPDEDEGPKRSLKLVGKR